MSLRAADEHSIGDTSQRHPRASVVIPTYGRRDSLLRVLRALSQQEGIATDAFEVLVICDGDVDGSVAACQALSAELPYALRVLEQANQGPAVARNRGVREARAPLTVFIDDDVVPDPELLATHLAAHADRDDLVAIGPLLPPPDFRLNAWGAWEERTLCRQYDEMTAGKWSATYRQFYTGNASLLRRHIREAGGFDAAYRRAEDVELAQRLEDLGVMFALLPEARGWHYVRRSFDAWQRMAAAYGEADVMMAQAGRQLELRLAFEHYRDRSWPVQLVTSLCLGRPALRTVAVAGLGVLARCANRLRWLRLGTVACSLIYNLRLYDGIAQHLGGRAAFREIQRQVDANQRPLQMPRQPAATQAATLVAR
jgi:GT2 family glycosyltransferase